MTKIAIEIERCKECPFFDTRNQWSSDGWDRMEDWYCKKANKTIEKNVEWNEEKDVKIPEWCSIIVK